MHRITYIILLLCLFLAPAGLKAQDVGAQKKETPLEIKKAATNLEKSLLDNDNPKIARNYEVLAQEYTDKDELPKALEFLLKAYDIYTAVQDAESKARVLRSIAHVQELQNQPGAASKNYRKAAETTQNQSLKILNLNDFNRLKNTGNLKAETTYLQSNINLLKKHKNEGEVADTYIQLAKLLLKNSDTTNALEQYRLALEYTGNIPVKAIKVYSEVARLNAAAKRFEDAIAAGRSVLEEAEKIKDVDTEISQLRHMGSIYFKMADTLNAVNALKESYSIATVNGKTFEARESLTLLAGHYKAIGNDSVSLALYEAFAQNLDRIILSDKSLTDAKTFKVTEERIRRLESEKGLKDELITKKNTFNYLLLGSIVVLLGLFVLIYKAFRSIKTKNKEIALQSLRLEMNPHFLFNSLNSVNQFIAQNDELAANKYLTSYSNLMRNTMENSNKDFITLGNEIDNLTKYLELEHLRFKDKFRFEINVDDQLDRETLWIPNMITQPHLENAIWHGLRYKEGKGVLKLDFRLRGNEMIITIDDDGIGPTKSSALKTHNQKAHQSRGLTNTQERMALLNQLYKTKMAFTVTEKNSPLTGTIVQITLPIITRPL